VSKKVPVLTAHTEGGGDVQDMFRALDVDGLEVRQVLAGATQQRGAVNRRIGTGPSAQHIVGVGDVAADDLDSQGNERLRVSRRASQGPDLVAALDQKSADVGAGQPGRAGDEDRLGHADVCSESSE
jgi:hypothetical protein